MSLEENLYCRAHWRMCKAFCCRPVCRSSPVGNPMILWRQVVGLGRGCCIKNRESSFLLKLVAGHKFLLIFVCAEISWEYAELGSLQNWHPGDILNAEAIFGKKLVAWSQVYWLFFLQKFYGGNAELGCKQEWHLWNSYMLSKILAKACWMVTSFFFLGGGANILWEYAELGLIQN